MGTPSKFSQKRVHRILEALRLGTTRRAASSAGGISQTTFANWLNEGENLPCQIKDAEGKTESLPFCDAVARAEDAFEQAQVAIIEAAAKPHDVTIKKTKTYLDDEGKTVKSVEETVIRTEHDWQAAAWLLERRRPKDFGRRVAIAGVEDEPIAVEVTWGDPRMDENTKARNHANGTAEEPTGDDAGARDPGGPEAGPPEGQDQPAGAPPSEPA